MKLGIQNWVRKLSKATQDTKKRGTGGTEGRRQMGAGAGVRYLIIILFVLY